MEVDSKKVAKKFVGENKTVAIGREWLGEGFNDHARSRGAQSAPEGQHKSPLEERAEGRRFYLINEAARQRAANEFTDWVTQSGQKNFTGQNIF